MRSLERLLTTIRAKAQKGNTMRVRSINKKPIADATEVLTFSVTRKDVNNGKSKDPMSCAIAQGLNGKKDVISVRIGQRVALVEYRDRVVRYGIRSEDTRKIAAFDAARYFQPGSYMLEIPKKKLSIHTVNHKRKSYRGDSTRGEHVSRRKPTRHAWRVTETV